jgi:thiol-disulfide isomerase/thioredoxin
VRRGLRALGAAVLAACGEPQAHAAGLAAADTAGIRNALAARAGQPLLVNFWAMWCAPCVQELPDLAAVAREFRASGGEVVLISLDMCQRGATLDAALEKIPQFLGERDIALPVLVLRDGDPLPLNESFDLPGAIPVTLAFDRTGREVARHEGLATREEFAALAAAAGR